MNAELDRDGQLDELLGRSYEELRQTSVEQRQSVLDRVFNEARPASPLIQNPGAHWRRWLIVAACVMALFSAWTWRPAGHEGVAFGIDDVPQRLAQVQSLSVRGWMWIRWGSGKDKKPPIRVPIETLFKRPGKFRFTSTGVSFGNGKPLVRQFVHVCDGEHEWQLDADHKLQFSRSLSTLDALLNAESMVQDWTELAVLGPPDAAYRKVATESQNGRRLDVYEARFPTEPRGGTIVARVWIDPKEGLPVRVLRNEVDADGTTAPSMELAEIAVNVPLADELFLVDAAKQSPRPGEGEAPAEPLSSGREKVTARQEPRPPSSPAPQATAPPPLELASKGGAYNGNEKLEPWYALRISDNAALVIWRRSAPITKSDAAPDWLANLTMAVPDFRGGAAVRHQWIYQSRDADHWNWSLVVPADGKSLGRGQIRLRLRGEQWIGSVSLMPLRLREDDLRQLLHAAQDAMLPKSMEEVSLPYLQAVARKLASEKAAD
jgi:outer membrane lipoprotein-sorting protein